MSVDSVRTPRLCIETLESSVMVLLLEPGDPRDCPKGPYPPSHPSRVLSSRDLLLWGPTPH